MSLGGEFHKCIHFTGGLLEHLCSCEKMKKGTTRRSSLPDDADFTTAACERVKFVQQKALLVLSLSPKSQRVAIAALGNTQQNNPPSCVAGFRQNARPT